MTFDGLQDFVFFISPPPHYRGTRNAFSPSIDECWYGRVNLVNRIFRFTLNIRFSGLIFRFKIRFTR